MATAAQPPYPPAAIDEFKKALDLHNANILEEAIVHYDKAVSTHKNFIEGWPV